MSRAIFIMLMLSFTGTSLAQTGWQWIVKAREEKNDELKIVYYTKSIEEKHNAYRHMAYNGRGFAYYMLGRFKEAEEDFKNAVDLRRNDEAYITDLADARRQLDDLQQSIADYTRAIQLNSKYTYAYNGRGLAYLSLSKYEEALADFNTATDLKPDYAPYYNYKGYTKEKLQRHAEAISDLNIAISLDPQNDWSYSLRGSSKFELGQYTDAEADQSRAIELRGDNAEYYYERASARYALKKFEPALADLDKAVELNANNINYFLLRGYTKEYLKKFQEAVDDYTICIQINPRIAEPYIQRGKIRIENAEYDEGLADLKMAYEINPQVPKLQEWIAAANNRKQNQAFIANQKLPEITKRVALVIGIQTYTSVPPLKNALNDAKDMSAVLKNKGFEVIELYDAVDKSRIREAVILFNKSLRDQPSGVGLLYYSGHGVQVDGANYLIPAAAQLEIRADVEEQCMNIDYVLRAMEENKNQLNIVILDACRNNPFRSFSRSGERGLSMIDAPKGSYIVYATKPGSVASDGEGRNGLFTSKLLKYINTPGLNIEQVFKYVADEVSKESGDAQRPWMNFDYTGDFFFTKN